MNTMNDCLESKAEVNPLSQADSIPNAAQNRQIEAACAQACQAIAPAWPLDRAIAVNPHWSRIGISIRQVAARMAVLAGIQVFPKRDSQLQAWDAGRISPLDLDLALQKFPTASSAGLSSAHCLEALHNSEKLEHLPLLIDVLDNDPQRDKRLSWRQAITHQVSQTCAAYFDAHQADWQPERSQGLYAFWRDTLQHDHGIGILMGLPELGRALKVLPATAQEAERWVLQRLGLPSEVWADYLEAVLLTVNGWASWCAYLGWQARLEGGEDKHLRELLAIRLAWGAILLECKDNASTSHAFTELKHAWGYAPMLLKQAESTLLIDEIWQVALETGYQRELASKLMQTGSVQTVGKQAIELQAAFCIDVRSEPMRRALEAVSPAVQTIGCAGFFGLPVAYTPLATQARRPQLPGLLPPTMEVKDRIVAADATVHANDEEVQNAASQARLDRFGIANQWQAASRWPSASFSFVEAAGVGYIAKLGQWLLPGKHTRERDDLAGLSSRYRAMCRPQIVGLALPAKVLLAAQVLHSIGLEGNFAPIVLLVGHGSQSKNNAHAAALDCGACCGQTGEVNVRSLAQLLNDMSVRAELREQGVVIPEETRFVAALHNTTTDEVESFDLDLLPVTARKRWDRMQDVFTQACDQVRRERAPRLGLDPSVPAGDLLDQLRRRANDGAQTRPEWGLAGNASFVIASRQRSRGLDLEGRSFLHDYEASEDVDGSVLELLMTAPMLVTHWINWQYNASTVDSLRLGSGNKLLHNVVGGNIGVFEGNGGDLRIGLSRQSLHDSKRWLHEPLRLTVVIDESQQAIDSVINKHVVIQQLINNGWLHLWRFDQSQLQRYEHVSWCALQLGRDR